MMEFVLPNAVLPSDTDQPSGPSAVKVLNSVRNAEEASHTTDKTAKSKKNKICRFFRAAWKAIKRPFKKNKVKPFVPPPQPDAESPNLEIKADVSPAKPSIKATIKPDEAKLKTSKIPVVPLLKIAVYPMNIRLRGGGPPLGKPNKAPAKSRPNPNPTATVSMPKTGKGQASPNIKAGAVPKTKTDAQSEPEVNNNLVPVKNDYIYDVSKILGHGAYGSVYEGLRKSDGEKVAVKVLSRRVLGVFTIPALDNHPYPSEVAMMLMLQRVPPHPNIIQMYDWCVHENSLTLVLEYPHPCKTLSSFIHSQRNLSESQAHGLWIQAVNAVHHCLKQGIFHTDIHTDNILVNTDSLELKLIDFGVGSIIVDPSLPLRGFYECREDMAMSQNVWVLGYMLYEMVHGFPASSKYYFDIMNPNISSELRDLIKKCTQKDPHLRPTIQEIMNDPWFKQTFSPQTQW